MCNLDESGERKILDNTTDLLNKYLRKEIEIETECFKFIISDVLFYRVYKKRSSNKENSDIRIKYDEFFKSFLNILLLWKANPINEDKYLLASKCLYQGPIFRTIGYLDNKKSNNVIFDNSYTHWSKIDTRNISSIESRIYRNKKYLSTIIDGNDYGIYIAPFIGMNKFEEEVVFPLFKSYKDKINIISIDINIDENNITEMLNLNTKNTLPKCKCLESLLIGYDFKNKTRRTC